MDVLEINDWHVLQRQPAEVVEWRLEILEQRGEAQAKQRDRIQGQSREVLTKPPPDIERSD